MKRKNFYPTFAESASGVITIIVLGSFLLIRGTTERTKFHSLSGKVTYLEKTYQELPIRHKGKYRYLSIDNYSKVFEIYIGKGSGEFKPHFERLDDLTIGDSIVVYFDENPKEEDARLNRLLQFIDKDSVPYFIRGNQDKKGGFIFIGVGILLGVLIIYLKKIGKIV